MEKNLNILEKYLEFTDKKTNIYIPEIWNKYVGFENIIKCPNHIIQVDEVEYYKFTIKKIKQLRTPINYEIKNSQIYCAMPRYTCAWDIHKSGSLSNGTLLRMLIILPMLKEMNINILYLLPITEYSNRNKKGEIGSPFAIKDFYRLDFNLHDKIADEIDNFSLDDEFHVLIESAHILGIRVVIDFIPRVTARDSNVIKDHPDWVYWIKKEYEKDFLTPEIPGLDFFQECTAENLKQVYSADSTKKHLLQFEFPPSIKAGEKWEKILQETKEDEVNFLQLTEERIGITTPPAHSDWINDIQPIWTDITFWKLFLDNNKIAAQYVNENQVPYVMFDTIKANKFPAKIPNQGLWDMFVDVMEYYTKTFKLDGFRFDIGHTLPKELLEKLFHKAREYVKKPIFISEDLFNRNHESAYRTGYNVMLGSSWKEVEKIKKTNYEEFITDLADMKIPAYACAETHDTPRIVSREGGINLARGLAIVNNFMPNGIHFILSGYEVNECQPMNCGLADNTGGADVAKAFFNNIHINWTSKNAFEMLDYLIKINKKRIEFKNFVQPEHLKLLKTNDKCIGYSYKEDLLILFNLNFKKSSTFYFDNINFSEYNEEINSSTSAKNAVLNNKMIRLAPAGSVLLKRIWR